MKRKLALILAFSLLLLLVSCGKTDVSEMIPEETVNTQDKIDKVDDFSENYSEESIRLALADSEYISETFNLTESDETNITLKDGKYFQRNTKVIKGRGIDNPNDNFNLIMYYTPQGGVIDCAIGIDVNHSDLDKAYNEIMGILKGYTSDDIVKNFESMRENNETSKLLESEVATIELKLTIRDEEIEQNIALSPEETEEAIKLYMEALEKDKYAKIDDYIYKSETTHRNFIAASVKYLGINPDKEVTQVDTTEAISKVLANHKIMLSDYDLLSSITYKPLVDATNLKDIAVEGMIITEEEGKDIISIGLQGLYPDGDYTSISIDATEDAVRLHLTSGYDTMENLYNFVYKIGTELFGFDAEKFDAEISGIKNLTSDDMNNLAYDSIIYTEEQDSMQINVLNIPIYGDYVEIKVN